MNGIAAKLDTRRPASIEQAAVLLWRAPGRAASRRVTWWEVGQPPALHGWTISVFPGWARFAW